MTPSPVAARFQIALILLELATSGLALALNRFLNRLDLLTTRQTVLIVAPLVVSLASGSYLAVQLTRPTGAAFRRLLFTVAANLIGVVLALTCAEGLVRALSIDTNVGRTFAGTTLLPKQWKEVKARNSALLARLPANLSYFVADDTLGWVPGPSRRDSTGMYATSVEGLRSAHPGVSYAARAVGHSVAIVGDSYTFGLEVPFDESWGARLERALGAKSVVLNFGVDGYGVDQAYLRYERDVRRWKPAVTAMGFIEHDLYRTLGVYSFITFPEWGFPFSKPRFVLKDGQLRRLNDPLESPPDLLARRSVADLPFITEDPGYLAEEWEQHAYHASHLLRFLFSRFPRSPRPGFDDEQNEALERINTALIMQFIRRASADGTIPLVVYFPSRGDFSGQDRSAKARVLTNLRRAGVEFIDLTSCIGAIGEGKAFITGRPHYSSAGNAAVATCLLPIIENRIAGD